MSRAVDVKALISHLIKGDGADKCRICMGDTSTGQVYLGDTVMMDGDKNLTLAELLVLITGVEVPMDAELPNGLCLQCSMSAMSAAAFRDLCQQAANQWNTTLHLLEGLPAPQDVESKSIIAIINNNQITILEDDMVSKKPLNVESSPLKTRLKRRKKVKITKQNCHCPECGKKFVYAQHLHDHLMESMDLRRACHICASIMPRGDLVNHIKHKHKCDVYDCKKCSAIFDSLKYYKRHLTKAHSSGVHCCGECGRTFRSMFAFRGHISMHNTKSCPGCDKLFLNHRCYLHHVKICCNLDTARGDTYRTKTKVLFEVKNNKSERKIKVGVRGSADIECICDYCGKTFAGKKFVSAHIQIVHMKNTHRPCPYCGKSYAAAHMTEHIKKHEDVQQFTCEHCGIMLRSKLGYVQHTRLHTGEKPYMCKFCPETFSASSRRSEHIRKTHKSADQLILKHACAFCPARFRLPFRLKRHVLSVHGDVDVGGRVEFECGECHVKFGSCRGLLHHSRKHQTFNFKSWKNKSDTAAVHEETV